MFNFNLQFFAHKRELVLPRTVETRIQEIRCEES